MSTMVNIRLSDEEIAWLDSIFKTRSEGIRQALKASMEVPRETNHKLMVAPQVEKIQELRAAHNTVIVEDGLIKPFGKPIAPIDETPRISPTAPRETIHKQGDGAIREDARRSEARHDADAPLLTSPAPLRSAYPSIEELKATFPESTKPKCTAMQEDPEGIGEPFRCELPTGHAGPHGTPRDRPKANATIGSLRADIPDNTRGFAKSRSECAHPFRQASGLCPTCGDQR